MLKINNLTVLVEKKEIIKGINLEIKEGEVVILFGPNGSGKSSLLKTIVGIGGYKIKKGEIIFKNKLLNNFSIEERIKLGIGIMYQHPVKIRGIKLSQIANFLCKNEERIEKLKRELSLEEQFLREINVNFSGGEMKRSELFQLLLQNPDLFLLDEPESGVDIENISIMGKILNNHLKKEKKAALIITHTGYILDYVKAERGYVMIEGKFWCVGNPFKIFHTIREKGYEKCKECLLCQKI